ncbi:MAG: hypothetical protein HC841_04215 [Verrucomicrobiae bacterium]|nr:hypothetical protein [Verrucomicrobiae bacterium]
MSRIRVAQAPRGARAAVLASTHHLDEAARCQSVVLLNNGRVAARGPYAELSASLDEHFERAA